jgi:hypothetical protein
LQELKEIEGLRQNYVKSHPELLYQDAEGKDREAPEEQAG